MNVTLQCNWQGFNSQAWGHVSQFIVLKADIMHWVANAEVLDFPPWRSQTKGKPWALLGVIPELQVQ